ncbi:MAG TPA: TRAP transporter small permease subunit [Thermosynergistes sp.]|nr:TRAP transporter small permease subunit [Thermosynergistes sp.]
MKHFFHRVNETLSVFCGWLMLAMMVLLVVDVCGRAIGRPVQGMAELSVFVMMIVIYLGMARCEEHKEHVNLEIVKNAFSPRTRRVIELSAYILALISIGIFFYALLQDAVASYVSREALAGIVELRLWPVKVVMVVGIAFFWIQTLINAVNDFSA